MGLLGLQDEQDRITRRSELIDNLATWSNIQNRLLGLNLNGRENTIWKGCSGVSMCGVHLDLHSLDGSCIQYERQGRREAEGRLSHDQISEV